MRLQDMEGGQLEKQLRVIAEKACRLLRDEAVKVEPKVNLNQDLRHETTTDGFVIKVFGGTHVHQVRITLIGETKLSYKSISR